MRRALALLPLLTVGAAHAEVTVRVQGPGGTYGGALADLIEQVVQPTLTGQDIRVVYEPLPGEYGGALRAALAARRSGDVLFVPGEDAGRIIASGRLLPLNDVLSAEPFIESLNRVFVQGKRQYALPARVDALAVVFNRDVFDEARVPYPTSEDTWASFAGKLRRVRAALGNDHHGVCLPAELSRLGPFALAAGWAPLDGRGRMNVLAAEFRSAAEWYAGLFNDRLAVLPSGLAQSWGGGCFATGRVAVALEGHEIVRFLRDQAPNVRYGSVRLPRSERTGRRGNFAFTDGWALDRSTRDRDAAARVLEALTGEQAQQFLLERGAGLPTRSALADSAVFRKSGAAAENARMVFQGVTDGNVYGYAFGALPAQEVARPVNEALADILTGGESVVAALRRAQAVLEVLLRR